MHDNSLLREATALFRFVGAIEAALGTARSSSRFPKWSDEFIKSATEAAVLTKERVAEDPCLTRSGPDRSDDYVGEFRDLLTAWSGLHDFIKPVLDATFIRAPHPLMELLNRQIGALPEFAEEKPRIIAGLTPQLNYYQHRHTQVRGLIRQLAARVGQRFPEFGQVAFVSLPFSQANALFMNSLLYHEAGHFVFEEKRLVDKISPRIDPLVRRKFPRLDERGRVWMLSTLSQWSEELFADLVAVKLLGPAYTVAATVLLQSLLRWGEEEVRRFGPAHPPHAMRFREQFNALTGDGWELKWDQFGLERLRELAACENRDLDAPSGDEGFRQNVWKPLMDVFYDYYSGIDELADEVLDGRENPWGLYQQSGDAAKASLAHGIVPSIVIGEDGKPARTHPVAVINAAVFYWLEGMRETFGLIEEADPEDLEIRAQLEGRLEMWAMKAIEDWVMVPDEQRKPEWPS